MMLGNTLIRKLCASYIQSASFARVSRYADPGTSRRLKISEDLKEIDLEDLDFEANFEAFNNSYKQHREELKAMREKMQYDIVKQKYFKTKLPNFLTWHDKEQIRLLHKKDPEEWDIMRLSEGFPAPPDIIKKIVKSKWRMDSVEKMKKHDESVKENWKKLKNNEFKDLPSDLVKHLLKFSNRKVNYHDYENMENNFKVEYRPQISCSEFSEIITSYEELTKKDKTNTLAIDSKIDFEGNELNSKKKPQPSKIVKCKSPPEEDTFFTTPIKKSELMTLDTLRNQVQSDLEKGKNISMEDISIIEVNKKEIVEESTNLIIDQMDYTKYNTGKLMKVDEKHPRCYDHLSYPEKINIPKKILKSGHTYKLNDCFYASDGTFLYRVPGM